MASLGRDTSVPFRKFPAHIRSPFGDELRDESAAVARG
jgi:hypothetical protein